MNTLDYYNENAEFYFDKTVNIDMSAQYTLFLKNLPSGGKILDFGCGSGRDTLYFKNLGYDVDSIDGSEKLCEMARKYANTNVKCMDFSELDSINEYDGVWACSSILHVKRNELIDILKKISVSLKLNGCLYTSFMDGNSEEVLEDGRRFNDLDKSTFEQMASLAGLELVDYSKTSFLTRTGIEKCWNNFVLIKK